MNYFTERLARKVEPELAEEAVFASVNAMQKALNNLIAQGTADAQSIVEHLVPLLRQAVTGVKTQEASDNALKILPQHIKALPNTRPQLFSELEERLKDILYVVDTDLPPALAGKEEEVFSVAQAVVAKGTLSAHEHEKQMLSACRGRC